MHANVISHAINSVKNARNEGVGRNPLDLPNPPRVNTADFQSCFGDGIFNFVRLITNRVVWTNRPIQDDPTSVGD